MSDEIKYCSKHPGSPINLGRCYQCGGEPDQKACLGRTGWWLVSFVAFMGKMRR